MDYIVKATFDERAKSANERQEAPSKKACEQKIESVIFRTIQHNAEMQFHSL
jgi:hypothetical protein